MERNNIGDAYKKQFENFEEQPTPEIWEGIQKNISKGSTSLLKYILIGSSIIVAGGILLFAITNIGKKEVAKESKVENTNIQNNNTATQSQIKIYNPFISNYSWLEKKDILFDYPIVLLKLNIDSKTVAKTETIDSTIEESVYTSSTVDSTLSQPLAPVESLPGINNNINSIEEVAPIIHEELKAPKIELPEEKKPEQAPVKPQQTEKKEVEILVPSAFAPNASTNNTFKALAKDVSTFEMVIFNKNGQQIFKSKDINQGWDGRINGTLAPAGAYIYKVRCTNSNKNTVEKQGVVNLIQ